MHAISDYKSSFLELLPHPPNYCFLKFLIVLCSSSEIPCHHIIATERGTMHRCLSHSTTLFLALRLPQLPPLTTPFFRPPSVFLVYNPPSSPSSCAFFFQAQRRWEAVLSVQKSIGLTHLWAGLQRQHHHCIWPYSMSKGGWLRWGRPRGASSAVYCIIEERISAISCRKTKAEIVLLAATDWRVLENRADHSWNPAADRQKLTCLYAGCPGICQVGLCECYSDGDL